MAQAQIEEGFIITKINSKIIKKIEDIETIIQNTTEAAVFLQGLYPNGTDGHYALRIK
jgi:hypothetical protein